MNKCDSCGTKLNYFRDGTDEEGHRCHNCYWEQEGQYMRSKDILPLIKPEYRKKYLKKKKTT